MSSATKTPGSFVQLDSQSDKMYICFLKVSWKELNASASYRNKEKVKKTKKVVILSSEKKF